MSIAVMGSQSAQAAQQVNLAIFAGGLSWPVYAAQDEGFFAKNGLNVTITEVPGSVPQIEGLMAGKFDIAMTPFDNVVAYQEGQGEVPLASPDLFAFMGGISGSLRLIVAPDIKTFAELRGKTLGIDSEYTGYTLAMYELLTRNGLSSGSYKLERTGGTSFRVKALTEGRVAGTMVSSPQEIPLEATGYRRLGDVQPMVGPYQAVSGTARRSWAAQHGDTLRAFIRAYIAASDWLADPAHRKLAVDVYLRHMPHDSADVADKAWDMVVAGKEGFEPKAKFDPAGARTVLQLRAKFGKPQKTLHDWSSYVDDSFYNQVIAQKP